MSGIAGVIRLDGAPVEPASLQPMLDAVRRRGPDAQGLWADGCAGLVCASLHTTPESLTTEQPYTTNSTLWITADARIDNRDELHKQFVANGVNILAGTSDAEYILRAYQVWDKACVDYLLGDFAFAIWDAAQQRLFCARDGFGIRTFCYYHSPALFVFGSEVRAILAWSHISPALFEPRIADYLVQSLEGIDTTSTFYQDIYRLPPGHTLTFENGSISIQQYWKLEPQPEIRYQRDEDYVEAFRDLFAAAVRCRLRAPSPNQVASMLSGGLDSSSIVGVARDIYRDQGRQPFKTLSAVAPDVDDEEPETHHSSAVIAQGHLDAIRIQPGDMQYYQSDLAYLLDHATDLFDHWMEIPQLMYVTARHQGIKAVLTGIGGDEFASLPSDYPIHLFRAGRLRHALAEISGTHRFYDLPVTRPASMIPRHLYHAFVPHWLSAIRERLRQNRRYAAVIENSVIDPGFAMRIDLEDRLKRLWASLDDSHFSSIQSERMYRCRHPYLIVGLERYDRVAAAHGIETRHPFTDRRLAEFLLALPWDQISRQGWSKFLVRQAMRGTLPDEVRLRKGRQHLGWQFQTARFQLEKTRLDWLMQVGLDRIATYADVVQIQAAFQQQDETNMRKLWYALTLAQFLKGL